VLTNDLLAARVRRGRVHPFYLDLEGEAAHDGLSRAAALIEIFQAHLGASRGDLDDALKARTSGSPHWRLERGLAKLLKDKSRFQGLSSEPAAALRARVFRAAALARVAGGNFQRTAVLERVAAELSPEDLELEQDAPLAVADLEHGLYGDLKRNERVISIWEPSPRQLLERYNLALAQACLLRAQSLQVEVLAADPPRLRQLLRQVKFQGLLQAARRKRGGKVVLQLDGPLSIFGGTARYGVKMAGFLPALLLCEDWRLEAQVELGRGRKLRKFELTPEQGLVTHARDVGAWLPDMIEAFAERFAELTQDWTVDREVPLLNLGGELVVPDFRFEHTSGFEASMEVLGYWRRGGVARRLEVLAEGGAPNLILAVDQSLRLGGEGVKGLSGPVVPFRELPNARTVLRTLEKLR
jgi:uncharacterized protein